MKKLTSQIASLSKEEKKQELEKSLSVITSLKDSDEILKAIVASLDANKIDISEVKTFDHIKNISEIKNEILKMDMDEKVDTRKKGYIRIMNQPVRIRTAILVAVLVLGAYYDVSAQELFEKAIDPSIGRADPFWA